MKKYESPMLQVVGIKRNEIVTASLGRGTDLGAGEVYEAGSAGRRMDDWDAGY